MAQQSPVLSALTSPKAFSALAGVALGIIIFLVTAFAMGLFTKPTEEQLLEQAREQAIPPELSRAKNDEFLAAHGKEAGYTVTASGMRYRVIKPGTGKKPESASATVKVHYTGKFIDGKTFDTSVGGEPAEFPLDGVVKGWTEGVQLMHVGEKAELILPYDLAYGPDGRRGIPPYQTLDFEVELLEVK